MSLHQQKKQTIWFKVAVFDPGASKTCGFFSSFLLFIIQLSRKTHVKLTVNRTEDSPVGTSIQVSPSNTLRE